MVSQNRIAINPHSSFFSLEQGLFKDAKADVDRYKVTH